MFGPFGISLPASLSIFDPVPVYLMSMRVARRKRIVMLQDKPGEVIPVPGVRAEDVDFQRAGTGTAGLKMLIADVG